MNFRNSFLAFLFFSSSAVAETVYIDDQIKVWSRTGHTNEYKVHYQLAPGTKFEVLQRNAESGFVEVRDEQGRTTWIDGKFLVSQPTAHQRLVEANREIARLKKVNSEKVSELQSKVNQMAP
ncbi:MAG: TIGR04211 family SH3 domain-containing protein, partial [Kangiellaceae bacterium]|nr:TIGR04211 family SH3 domain-containing protein [Kangiellaceae bacterium]